MLARKAGAVRRGWPPAGFQVAPRRPAAGPEEAAGQSAPGSRFVVPGGGPQPRFFLRRQGFLIESAPAYRYLRCMRGMYILPRESTAAVTRPAGNFVGLCDGHTFCPVMR